MEFSGVEVLIFPRDDRRTAQTRRGNFFLFKLFLSLSRCLRWKKESFSRLARFRPRFSCNLFLYPSLDSTDIKALIDHIVLVVYKTRLIDFPCDILDFVYKREGGGRSHKNRIYVILVKLELVIHMFLIHILVSKLLLMSE